VQQSGCGRTGGEALKTRVAITVLLGSLLFVATASAASVTATSYSASVNAPPKVQRVGRTYFMTLVVRNKGAAVQPFCIDFTDDHGSWDIAMPGLSSWDSDTFCTRLPAHRRKTFAARVIAARTGTHTMKILIGKAKLYSTLHDAIVVDDHALGWQEQFVLVG
jgi:hypothetical protein